MATTETLSRIDDPAPSAATDGAALVVALRAFRPLAEPASVALDPEGTCAIGRGAKEDLASPADLRFDDPWMSAAHGRLFTFRGAWVIEDPGSKNGIFVNGQRVIGRQAIEDGDVLELGQTFFVLRARDAISDPALAPDATLPAGLATFSPLFRRVVRDLVRVARANVPVIVLGETGTGKEVTARAIHEISGRSGPFVAVSCAALPAALVEGQLFGHKRGAFSGATEEAIGLVRAADRGTLLLDEVGELPEPAQAALLRVLQEGEVLPIGATKPVRVDVRVVSATWRPLADMVNSGRFRRDLFARLAGFTAELPPLRERPEDLGLAISAILRKIAPDRSPRITFEPKAARAIFAYDWPENIRQLEKTLATALALAETDKLTKAHLPPQIAEAEAAAPDAPADPLKEQLIRSFRANGGNVSRVAREMGKARTQVQRWVKRFGLDPEAFRKA